MDFKFVNNPSPKPESSGKKGNKPTSSFIPIEPEWTLDEVILSATTRGSLDDIVSFCKNKDKIIQMKTDNDDLYEYSLESLISYGYDVVKTDTNYFDTITTEYEDKFTSKGMKINYLEATKEVKL